MLRDIAIGISRHEEELAFNHWRICACLLCLCIACSIPWLAPQLSGFASAVLLYVLLATGLSLELHLAGLPDLNYASWFAIGAYADGLMARYSGLPFWACLPVAVILAGLVAALITCSFLQWRIELFGMLTLVLGFALHTVLARSAPSTVLSFPAIPASLEYWSLLLATAIAALISARVLRSPLGRILRAARQDEPACDRIGVDIRFCRLVVLAIGAGFAGAAGGIFAAGQGGIAPAEFDFSATAVPFAIAVLGGRHGQFGIIIAAIGLAAMLGLFPAASDYRLLIAGIAVVGWVIWRGVAKTYVPQPEQSAESLTAAEITAE
jgi:branched-chain amino acid transport system permease protein